VVAQLGTVLVGDRYRRAIAHSHLVLVVNFISLSLAEVQLEAILLSLGVGSVGMQAVALELHLKQWVAFVGAFIAVALLMGAFIKPSHFTTWEAVDSA